MAINDNQLLFLNNLLSLSLQKIIVPSDFHSRVRAVISMLDDDVTGIVDSLTDFQVQSASVDFNIETNNPELTRILKKWLRNLNKDFDGKVPTGIRPLAEEYFKERWKYSSFPILNISKWDADPKSKLILPSRMFFLDGGSIHAKDKNPDGDKLSLDQFDYFVGQDMKSRNKLGSNVIFSRPNGRWHDKFPNPFLIKRGVYRNWRIIEAIKRNEIDVLDQVIPYLLLIKKGTEKLTIEKGISYDDIKLKKVIDQLQELANKIKDPQTHKDFTTKTPVRASQFDEELKHFIPDLEDLFKSELFEVAEKNILSGLGFIDIVDGAGSTRRESVLNPKPFIQEVHTGVSAFRQILKDLMVKIIEKNDDHPKYMNATFEITSTPIKGFMTDKFKERIRQLWDRGLISSKTAVEIIGELDFEVQVQRRENEAKSGTDLVMYPHLTENKEEKAFDVAGMDTDDSDIPDDKSDKVEKKNFDKASLNTFENPLEEEMELIGSPFASVRDLPKQITDRIKSIDKRRAWLSIFNSAFNFYKGKFGDIERAEALAFATANSRIKRVKLKSKKKSKSARIPDKAQLEEKSLDKEIKNKQKSLLDKLLKRTDKE